MQFRHADEKIPIDSLHGGATAAAAHPPPAGRAHIRPVYGIDMSICPAISMRDALGLHLSSSLPLSREGALYAQCSAAEQKRMVLGLAHRVCYEMNRRLVISATSVVATVVLTNLNRGISRRDIIQRAEAVKRMIVERGGSVAHIFAVEPMAAVVDRALKVLQKLLSEQHGIVYGFRNVTSLELSFYRNQLVHLFIQESIVCVAMAAEYKSGKMDAPAAGQSAATAAAVPVAVATASDACDAQSQPAAHSSNNSSSNSNSGVLKSKLIER
jgi:hypothetical protein